MSQSPQTEATSILEQINLLQREPFRKELARLLQCAPTDEALQEFADKQPDRWAQAIAILSRASGYHEKVINETNIYMMVQQLPDAGLEMELMQVEQKLEKLNKQTIAGEVVYVPDNEEAEEDYKGNEDTAEHQQDLRSGECDTDTGVPERGTEEV